MERIKDTIIRLTVLALLLAAFSPASARAQSDDEEEERDVKILFELYSDDAQARKKLVDTVQATRRSFEGMAQLTVVLSHDAVAIARSGSPDMPEGLRRLMNQGVEVLACERALEANEIGPADLDPAIGTVESAAEEVRRRSENGWVIVGEGETYVSGLHD